MWYKLGQLVLKYRIVLLVLLLAATGYMGWQASKVSISYEFAKAIPTDNPKYVEYTTFKQQFGEDGSVLVVGVQTDHFFQLAHFTQYKKLLADIKAIPGVENIVAVPSAINLVKNDSMETLIPSPIFTDGTNSQSLLDTARAQFENLVFYQRLMYNPTSKAYLAGVTINKEILKSKARVKVVAGIVAAVNNYEKITNVPTHVSGLPLIRTQVADRIEKEMRYFLLGSLALAVITLLLFFRSISSTAISLVVVLMGVVWSMGTMQLFGYKISLLTALIPPLIIVIGIPNCIYFLNKYHMAWQHQRADTTQAIPVAKKNALLEMVSKMGVVTLFCNIAAAIGFAVFALTKSDLLKEFGAVAGINIMVLFVISFIFIPAMLSFLPPPKDRHTKYLRNRFLERVLVRVENWVVYNKGKVIGFTTLLVIVSVVGIMRIKSIGYIVDDLPKKDKIYTDLKWFEKNFGGVMPLEIVIDTKKKNGLTNNIKTIEKIDEFSAYIAGDTSFARPLSLVEGLKFVKQAYYDGDSTQYTAPNEFDMAFLSPYLRMKGGGAENSFTRLVKTFMDSTRQKARISLSMADIGTVRLPVMLDSLRKKSGEIFDSSYNVQFTGSSITYLEGSRFIIQGLKESILWAFLLIALCMFLLFRSVKILVCSLIPNLIPLVVTAGLMGWAGVPLKPSTVLVFSVALGIAIDITIRFLVNYKQELASHNNDVVTTTVSTIRHTGISIIYTSLVLIAGFVIFVFSSFGGTMALGWLTSFTLLVATFTNLVFLPVLLIGLLGKKKG
ncbi:MAG: MMPL family transporter [Chitinophagaceae bacterium]